MRPVSSITAPRVFLCVWIAARPRSVIEAAGAMIQEAKSITTTMAQATARPLCRRRASFNPRLTARQINRSTT